MNIKEEEKRVDLSQQLPWCSSLDPYYELHDKLGEGAFGTVYGGTRKSDGLAVAIKKIPKYQVNRFGSLNGKKVPIEIQLLSQVSGHPGIVEMVDYCEIENDYILIMERPHPVMDLFDYLVKYGPQPEEIVRKIMVQLIKAVLHSHANGVFHRDIKDENVLINLRTMEAKLIDFGCGDLLHAFPYYTFNGTRTYAPPEWFKERRYHGKECDVWGLGQLFYILLENDRPFSSKRDIMEKDVKFNSDLSPSCKRLVKWMLAKDLRKRPTLEDVLKHNWFTNSPASN